MRTSSYVIYVDLPDRTDEMLLVHGYTGAYDKVSKSVARYLQAMEAQKVPKPLYGSWKSEPRVDGPLEPLADETMAVLRRRGYLTEMTVSDERQFFDRLVHKLHERRSGGMPSYIVMPTYDCNLRCSYCFQDHMRTDAQFRHLCQVMSRTTADRMFTAMHELESRQGVSPSDSAARPIGFFGGEPFLRSTREIVEHIISGARALGPTTFWAVTNATELDAFEDLLGPDLIARLQITLDGPPAEHDQRRIYADGSGSFDRIARHVTMALERDVTVTIRLNLDRNNITMLPALGAVMVEKGWPSFKRFSVYTAPIRAANKNVDRSALFNSWELAVKLRELRAADPTLNIIAAPDDGSRASARRVFASDGQSVPSLRAAFCGAHTNMYIFDSFGDIYACWERTGEPSVRIGHVDENGALNMDRALTDYWRSRTVTSNPVCNQCRYSLHCGGGCAVLAERSSGHINMNYCDGFGIRFRSSVAAAYQAQLAGAAPTETLESLCDR